MKIQVLTAVVAVVLAGRVSGDTKVVAAPYSLPGVVVVGEAPAKTISYVHRSAAAVVPAVRSTAFHYDVPQAVQYVAAAPAVEYTVPQAVQYAAVPAVQYTVPQAVQYRAAPAVQYTVPQAVQYAAVPAVRSASVVHSAAYSLGQPAAAVVSDVGSSEEVRVDVARPLTYGASVVTHDVSLEERDVDSVRVAVPYGILDEDHFDHADSHDRK